MKSTKISIDNEKVEVNLPTSIAPSPTAKMVIVDNNNKLALSGISVLGGLFDSNKPITANLPGLQGKVIGKTSVADFLNGVFFPSIPPTLTLSVDSPVRLFGGSLNVLITYSYLKNTSDILSLVINEINQTISSSTTSGTYSTVITTPNKSTGYSGKVTAFNGDEGTAYVSVEFKHLAYTFKEANNLLTLSDGALSQALINNGYPESFADARQVDKTLNLANEYSYFIYPKSFGVASFIVGGLPNTAFILKEFTHVNGFGYSEPYYLYRSGSKGTGSIRVQLN